MEFSRVITRITSSIKNIIMPESSCFSRSLYCYMVVIWCFHSEKKKTEKMSELNYSVYVHDISSAILNISLAFLLLFVDGRGNCWFHVSYCRSSMYYLYFAILVFESKRRGRKLAIYLNKDLFTNRIYRFCWTDDPK